MTNKDKHSRIERFLNNGSFLAEMIKMSILMSLVVGVMYKVRHDGPKLYAYFMEAPQRIQSNKMRRQKHNHYRAAVRQAKLDLLELQFNNCQRQATSETAFKVCLAKIESP